jgi:hypothetical protein
MAFLCFGKFYDSEGCEDCSSYHSCEDEHNRWKKVDKHLEILDTLANAYSEYPSFIETINHCKDLIKDVD